MEIFVAEVDGEVKELHITDTTQEAAARNYGFVPKKEYELNKVAAEKAALRKQKIAEFEAQLDEEETKGKK